jgi:hypothetical protein
MKQKRYWLRGGMEGLLVWAIIAAITSILIRLPIWGNAMIDFIIQGPVYFPGVLLFGIDGAYGLGLFLHPSTISTIIIYVLVGSFIGWRYGRNHRGMTTN